MLSRPPPLVAQDTPRQAPARRRAVARLARGRAEAGESARLSRVARERRRTRKLPHNVVIHPTSRMPPISLEDTFVVSKDAVFRDLDGEAVILDLNAGTYFGLNEVGTRVWQLIAEKGTLKTVFDALCAEYDVAPETLERDLLALVSSLVEARLGRVT